MADEVKTVQINKEIHEQLKKYSESTGVKIKVLVETSIRSYLKHIILEEKNVRVS
jgi:hypothetical protein